MPIHISDLLERIPSDTKTVVDRTRTRFNSVIRQMLRQETGMRLAKARDVEKEDHEAHSIRVFVDVAFPIELQNLRFDDDKRQAILLAPWRSQLKGLRDSSFELRENLIGLLSTDFVCEGRFAGIGFKLHDVSSFAEELLKIADQFNLVKELHCVNEDVLGRYQFSLKGGQTSASAYLYWAVIGLVARSLGISLEGLTVKVLVHELAHAYTHLGTDIDGHRWDDDAFTYADRAVKEGLAQYYTRQLLNRLRSRIPDAKQAYEALLPHQPYEYQVQEKWITEGATPEHVRLAMVLFRRGRKTTLSDFESILNQAKKDLRTPARNYLVSDEDV